MKSRILQILGVAAIATIGMVSCDTDACKDVDCGMYGVCVDGDCECDLGYEGVACATESRADFIGSYTANEADCNLVNFNTSMAASSTGADKIAITGFGGFECSGSPIVVIATVSGNDVTIASQSFCSETIVVNSGSGSINASGTIVTITYNATFQGTTGNCTTVYTPL
ncbi:MAG: hypothetical protein K9G41_05395 [Flavobacteriales bacterium]|nr:hypothetical protein [Flavobacteriales bacterium]